MYIYIRMPCCVLTPYNVVAAGDFHQLPPVVKGREAAAARKFAFEAATWRQCVHHCAQLTKVFRQVSKTFFCSSLKISSGAARKNCMWLVDGNVTAASGRLKVTWQRRQGLPDRLSHANLPTEEQVCLAHYCPHSCYFPSSLLYCYSHLIIKGSCL